jgi:hypothetical protein
MNTIMEKDLMDIIIKMVMEVPNRSMVGTKIIIMVEAEGIGITKEKIHITIIINLEIIIMVMAEIARIVQGLDLSIKKKKEK